MTRAAAAALTDDDECDLYLRMSKDRQGLEYGVDRQEKDCRALCERMGWRVRCVWRDNAKSASNGRKRPHFEQMIVARPRRIVMWSVDRLVRKGEDLERLIKLDVPVHSVMAGPMDLATASGRLNARLLTSVATFEGEIKAERQQASNIQKAARGERWWPGRPFGLEMDGTLRPDEAKLVAEGYDMLIAGSSLGDISRHFNDRGFTTSRGNRWTQAGVSDLLISPRNAGINTYRGEEVGKGNWEPIVPEDIYRKAARIMTNPSRRKKPEGARIHLLTGIATCGSCEGPLKVQRVVGKRSKGHLYYMCRTKSCAAAQVDHLDRFVIRAIMRILTDPAASHVWATGAVDVHALRAEVATIEREMEEYVEDRKAGILDRAAFNELYLAAKGRLEGVQGQLDSAKGVSPVSALVEAADVAEAWGGLTLEQKRSAVAWLLPRIQLLPRGKGRRPFGPDCVAMTHRTEMPEAS